jgi:hypothetical protein
METVEHFAKIALITHLLGHQQELSTQEIEKLIVARSKYQGAKSAAPMPVQALNGSPSGNNHGRPTVSTEREVPEPRSRRVTSPQR